MANETRITFTEEQKEAWKKAKASLKKTGNRSLHIAMSELRAENGRRHRGPIETLPKTPGKLQQYQSIYRSGAIAERVKEWKDYLRNPGAKKLYIIVRDDLSPAQKAVQASHCAAQFQKEHPLAPWINGTMVLLQNDPSDPYFKRYVDNSFGWPKKKDFDPFTSYVTNVFWRQDYKTYWHEPDLGNKLTAVAVLNAYQNELIGKQPGIKLI